MTTQFVIVFEFSDNHVYLHSDPELMPAARRAWASWNYSAEPDGRLSVSHWMNRLQSLDDRQQLFVSLNPVAKPRAEHIYAGADYHHPVFNLAAIHAQRRLADIQALKISISVCMDSHGFHEDGLKSAVSTALSLAADVPWQTLISHWHSAEHISTAHSA